MLERIQQITGVGLFRDIRAASMPLKKMTFIYADNGRGKSTLASILRSYTESNADIVRHRKTIGATIPQHINLLFSQGNRARFENDTWTGKYSDVHVFDLDFVDRNVYSGGEISPGHRKRLLSFALGSDAVAARTAFNDASGKADEAKRALRLASEKLTIPRGSVTLARYIKPVQDVNIDAKIADVRSELDLCKRVETIRNRTGYLLLPLYAPDFITFISILSANYDSLSAGAEEAVCAHIDHINTESFERWASSGLDFIKDNHCPFCAQSLEGVELIRHYRERFNIAYKSLLNQVAYLDNVIATAMRVFNLALLENKIEQAGLVTENWKDCLQLAVVLPDFDKIKGVVQDLQAVLSRLAEAKKNAPLSEMQGEYEKEIDDAVTAINDELSAFNTAATAANLKIQAYKETLETKNEETLRVTLSQHEATRLRLSPDVVGLISDYVAAKTAEAAASKLKETRRGELNAIMDATLGTYQSSINDLLMKFGASFRITEINYNYAGGGEPKSEYAIELRGEKISLTGDGSSFRSSLSEGDKRTLAFAFFISVLFHDSDLERKVVVIDDPMCSLDNHRKNHTITIIKQIHLRSLQVIILAHDLFFVRTLRNEFLKIPSTQIQDISTLRIIHSAGDFSDLAKLDVDLECESPYYKNHRMVSGYADGTHHQLHDTAVAIRPLLEGYLHRRFPGKISPGNLFGEVVLQIAQSQPNDPLFFAKSLVPELNEINNYAGRYHHDTNPQASFEPITPSELMSYSKRALNVIYRGHI
ncbi:AAA family ATPase [Pantoea agglomerans]|uniref:Wobble nucleotide-excising tRNase n=1 Tax=Enterobacter agglomerans TaxID=549 RepID=A0ABD6XJX7_ENTAG